jgi:hypothetical protein
MPTQPDKPTPLPDSVLCVPPEHTLSAEVHSPHKRDPLVVSKIYITNFREMRGERPPASY